MSSPEHPFALPAEERLRNRGAVSRLFNEGRSGFSYPLRYVWIEALPSAKSTVESSTDLSVDDAPLATLLFNVPKRFHRRANKRNLLRRRIKEAYRVQKDKLLRSEGAEGAKTTLHIALVYSTKESLTYTQIHRAVGKIIDAINDERAKTTEQRLSEQD